MFDVYDKLFFDAPAEFSTIILLNFFLSYILEGRN